MSDERSRLTIRDRLESLGLEIPPGQVPPPDVALTYRRHVRWGDTVWIAGHGPTLFAGRSTALDLVPVSREEFGSGAVATRYEPRRTSA